MKLSFLIPAHNEEKIIAKTLSSLINLPYDNYEVLIGLDGCTDNTLNIVKEFQKKSKKIKYFELKSRNGKPEVIDTIVKKATGDILIINDADWKFKVNKSEDLKKMILLFNDPKLGGISESFPIEFDQELLSSSNSLAFKSAAFANSFWFDYQREKFTKEKNNLLYIDKEKMMFPFLINIFRKELYKKNITLGDDFERTLDILNNDYEIMVPKDINMPRMVALFDKTTFKDIYKQKVRTSLAREQLHSKYKLKANLFNFYLPLLFYTIRSIKKTKSLKITFGVFIWLFIVFLSSIHNKFFKRKKDTKSGWLMRANR
ncbi:glycosyltransferase [Candidatus Woesearchaeota archaeon]|nr:glycosyltransferase [Candidatus Woesearchaeota archaeon]